MSNIPIPDPAKIEKLMADLDAVDFDDLGNDFRGGAVNEDQWYKYQMIVKALLTAKNKGQGVSKVEYLTAPDQLSEYAGAMIVLNKLASLDGDAFTVDAIWKEDGNYQN